MCSVNALATFSDNTVSLLFMRMRVAKICPPIDKLKIVRSGGRLNKRGLLHINRTAPGTRRL